MPKEIEIKIKLDENRFFKVKKKLDVIAKFKKKLQQIDEYFTPAHRNFISPEYPFEWLRVGKRGNKFILNYKHWHPENVEVSTHCDEFETEIKNPDKLKKIFSAIDIKKLITVDKEREIYIYNNEFEIALDVVKDLGYFIEIEALKEFENVEATRKKLFAFAKTLGLENFETDKRGYPFLLMEKNGLLNK